MLKRDYAKVLYALFFVFGENEGKRLFKLIFK